MDEGVARGYSRSGDGDVVLTMSRDDYEMVMLRLGAAAWQFGVTQTCLLVNRLNVGNPAFRQYLTRPCEAEPVVGEA